MGQGTGAPIPLIDTSWLIAATSEQDKFHRNARPEEWLGQRLILLPEIILEFVSVMLRRAASRRVSDVLRSILDGPYEVHRGAAADEVCDWTGRADDVYERIKRGGHRPLSVEDLVLLGVSQRIGESILTFDGGIGAAIGAKLFPGARIA